jgi:hypothetical protein
MLLAVATAAQAQNTFGPRLGFSSVPDQFVFGGQMGFPNIAPKVSVDPDLELGFGDHTTTIQLSADFLYHFKIQDSAWSPYAGAGPSIAFFSFDAPPGVDDSETDAGLNLVVGASVPTKTKNQFFVELKFGLGDIPDFKAIAGWNFPM